MPNEQFESNRRWLGAWLQCQVVFSFVQTLFRKESYLYSCRGTINWKNMKKNKKLLRICSLMDKTEIFQYWAIKFFSDATLQKRSNMRFFLVLNISILDHYTEWLRQIEPCIKRKQFRMWRRFAQRTGWGVSFLELQ